MSFSKSTNPRWGLTSFAQILRERRERAGVYGAAKYWNVRAKNRDRLARAIWPSNTFNEFWDERQRLLLKRMLGSMDGRRILDVGCGTGRLARFFVEHGAGEVVGIDFSDEMIRISSEENAECSAVKFVQGDVVSGVDHVGVDYFDDVVVLGCLSVACDTREKLGQALVNISRVLRVDGRLLLMEPIHRSSLLKRILALGIEDWISAANHTGFELIAADRMGMVPVRFAFATYDLPRPVVGPIFRAGEALLERVPSLAPLSDYKALLFRKTTLSSRSSQPDGAKEGT